MSKNIFIEEQKEFQTQPYEKTIEYIKKEKNSNNDFRWNFFVGEFVDSSKTPGNESSIDTNDSDLLSSMKSSFVYLDVGVWSEYDGQYNFGLICGPDVYLMEFVPKESISKGLVSKNNLVNDFLEGITKSGHSFKVVSYAQSQNMHEEHQKTQEIYLFLPDYHLPPISWFYKKNSKSGSSESIPNDSWPLNTSFFKDINSDSSNLKKLLGQKIFDDSKGSRKKHKSDIFGGAGNALVLFLNCIINTNSALKKYLHVVQMGDMFELWMSRPYQFRAKENSQRPILVSGGEKNIQSWVLESILMNLDVMKAHKKIEDDVKTGNIAEVRYIWGNHDSYLMYDTITTSCDIPSRIRSFNSPNNLIHAEHGHRFDSFNHDFIKQTSGGKNDPWGVRLSNLTFKFPGIRKLEAKGRKIVKAISKGPEFRDIFVLGASIAHLNQKIHQEKHPFGIFVMGHTHIRDLRIVNIRTKYLKKQ
jgi:UDP-2,3-diacylglucosamine pyrophosphatase LpxH